MWGIANKTKCEPKDFTAILNTADKIYKKSKIAVYQEQILKEIVAVQTKKAQREKQDFTEAITTASQIKAPRYSMAIAILQLTVRPLRTTVHESRILEQSNHLILAVLVELTSVV